MIKQNFLKILSFTVVLTSYSAIGGCIPQEPVIKNNESTSSIPQIPEEESGSVTESMTVTIGGRVFSVPSPYTTAPTEVWRGDQLPNNYCVIPGGDPYESTDEPTDVATISHPISAFEWIRISSPNLCKTLYEAGAYCFVREQKTVYMGKSEIELTYVYNNFDAVNWDVREADGSPTCEFYVPEPEHHMWTEGCSSDGLCLYGYMKPENLEPLLGTMDEL